MRSETRRFLEKLADQHARDAEHHTRQAQMLRDILEKEEDVGLPTAADVRGILREDKP